MLQNSLWNKSHERNEQQWVIAIKKEMGKNVFHATKDERI